MRLLDFRVTVRVDKGMGPEGPTALHLRLQLVGPAFSVCGGC